MTTIFHAFERPMPGKERFKSDLHANLSLRVTLRCKIRLRLYSNTLCRKPRGQNSPLFFLALSYANKRRVFIMSYTFVKQVLISKNYF